MLGHSAREQRIADNLTRLQTYEDLAAELELSPTVLALAWLLSRPGVTAPVLGPPHPRTADRVLPRDRRQPRTAILARLDELFPGPGKAPDAYTW